MRSTPRNVLHSIRFCMLLAVVALLSGCKMQGSMLAQLQPACVVELAGYEYRLHIQEHWPSSLGPPPQVNGQLRTFDCIEDDFPDRTEIAKRDICVVMIHADGATKAAEDAYVAVFKKLGYCPFVGQLVYVGPGNQQHQSPMHRGLTMPK